MALSMQVTKFTPVLVSSQASNRDVLDSSKSGKRYRRTVREALYLYTILGNLAGGSEQGREKESSKISHKAE